MATSKKEPPRSVDALAGGKKQNADKIRVTAIEFGVKLGAVAACRDCGYFREIPMQARARRLCAWTGEKLAADAETSDCAGFHAGGWGQLWAV